MPVLCANCETKKGIKNLVVWKKVGGRWVAYDATRGRDGAATVTETVHACYREGAPDAARGGSS